MRAEEVGGAAAGLLLLPLGLTSAITDADQHRPATELEVPMIEEATPPLANEVAA